MTTVWEMAGYLAVPGHVFVVALFCAVLFSHKMSWMRSGMELSQFLRIFLPAFPHCMDSFISFALVLAFHGQFLKENYTHSKGNLGN